MADDDYEAALAAFELRYQEVKEAIRGLRDPSARMGAWTEVGDTITRVCIPQAADCRKDAARRIYEQEELTFAQLGRRLGMTRQRAYQLIKGTPKHAAAKRVMPPPVSVLPETELTGMPPATALYRLWNSDGVLLYVGIADNIKARFDDHKAEKSWWGDVARVTATWYGSRGDAFRAEDIAIKSELPIYNIAGAPIGVEGIRR